MGEKQRLIEKMIQMQKKFIEQQRRAGVTSQQYYLPDEDGELRGYNEAYEKMSARVVDLAHRENKTSR